MKKRTIPDLYLEQTLLDELPDGNKDILNKEGVADRLAKLRNSNEEILKTYDPGSVVAAIQERLEQCRLEEDAAEPEENVVRRWFGQHRTSVALMAAAIAVFAGVSPLLFRQNAAVDPSVNGTEITRIKGMEPAIAIYRKLEGSVEQLFDDSVTRENDLLQISYNAAGKPFGVIFSIDGRGVVTLHYPTVRDGSLVLKREGEVALEYSYRLDDAPMFEQFYFVTSDTTFNIEIVLSAAGVLADRLVRRQPDAELQLPDGFEIASLSVKKEASK